jgi:6-phosphogluconolactonase
VTLTYAYVGSRTTRERNARGEGLTVYRFTDIAVPWERVQLIDGLVNPSFLAFDWTRRYLYAVHGDETEISAFAIDPKTRRLTFLNRVDIGGRNPVHLAVDPGNRFILVANHLTSTIAVLVRREDGKVGEIVHLVTLEGTIGPHRIEQPFAKPHQVEFDRTGRFVIVPDKGLDCVFVYAFDSETGSLMLASAALTREGAGPRHVVLHPSNRFAYIVNELDSTIATYRFDEGTGALDPLQIVSALPDDVFVHSRAAEIAVSVDGAHVHASNRGHDSIATFAIDAATGRLTAQTWRSSGGRTPRFFLAMNDGLVVANEDSDALMYLSASEGAVDLGQQTAVAKTGSPVCVLAMPSHR